MEGRSRQPAIGIDLGTSYSCAAVWRNNQIEIIANDQGDRTTPSWVAFTETHRYIGEGAKQQAIRNYQNTVFDVKRLIGKRFSDPSVQHDLHNWPFKVISGEGDKPVIVVLYKFERKEFCPEEISSFVLSKMVDIAQAFLDSPVKDIVVTVPAYFDDQQRQATIDAGKIAGLNVMAIMNEPTAAAMAYGFDKKPDSQILIFDLGGGTFDISIAEVKGGTIKVIATTGDTHLGGLDFNNNMVDYFVEEIKTKHNEDIRGNTKALGKLRARCERAKRTLSVLTQADIEIDSLVADFDFCSSITRAQFEDINMHLFKKCMHTVEECLRDANMDKSNIDDVVLVGGSTKIPMIQSMLQEFFNGKVLSKGINPDEAVAYGAALKAAYLSNNKVQDMVLQDVTPLSFGTDIRGGLVDVVIPRNTSIPTKKEKLYYTTVDNQPWMPLEVYMGEGRYIKDCKLLEKFTFTGIPPAPKGQSTITVTFEIDTDGILTVSAVDNTNGGNRMEVTIANDQGRLTSEEIGRMVKDAEKYNADDQNHMINVKAKNGLETVIINLEKCMLEDDDVGSENKATIQSLIEPIGTWLKSNKLVDRDKFRLEYEEHVALLSNAVENIPNNSSKRDPWYSSNFKLRFKEKKGKDDQREEKGKKDCAGVVIMADKGKSKVIDDIDRVQWSDGMRKCLVDICLEQVKSGGRPGIQFISKAWKMIIEKFTQRTGHSFNQKQLKNQLDNLKKLYNAWLHLRSQTGIGFNQHTGCVEMEQDRWTEYLKTHKDAKIFKSKPLPFPEEMAALFDGTLARGDDKWAPTMDGVPEDIITDMDSSFFNLDHDDDTPPLNLTNSRSSTLLEDSAASDIAADVMMANIRKKRPRPSKTQSMAGNDALNACIMDLAASVKASNQSAIAQVQSEGPTIDECIDVLNAMPEISEASPLYVIALTCFLVKDKRTIWMRLKTNEGKMAWLKNQLQLEKGNASGSDIGL